MIKNFYDKVILQYPKTVLFCLVFAISLLFALTPALKIDASSETLVLKNDKDFSFLKHIGKTFAAKDFLVIAYTPKQGILSESSMETIKNLATELSQLEQVYSITSILNVPLLLSPIKPIADLLDFIPTLKKDEKSLKMAKQEFLTSPFYKNSLVSKDFKTTAILVNLKEQIAFNTLSDEAYKDLQRKKNHLFIQKIKQTLKKYEKSGALFLGGVSMIADDMIEFIKLDLKLYGSILFALMIVILWVIFRELKWIFLSVFVNSS